MKPINLFKPEQSDFKQMLSIGGRQVYLNSNKILAMITNADTYQFDEKRLSTDRMFSRGDIAYYDDDYYMITTQVAHRYESFNGQMRRLENHIYFNMSFLPDSPNKYIMKIPVIPQKTGEFNLRTNNTWGIVDVVQRISLFVPENEWTSRISELENQPDGIIIFGRRPYKIIGVTNNDKGMYAINLELTALADEKYDKDNGIYMPPTNWKDYENLSIYDLSVDPTEPIPQVQTDVGIIRTIVSTWGWDTELEVYWEKDKSSPLYEEFLTGYRVRLYYDGVLGSEKVISNPSTTEVKLDNFNDSKKNYTVKIEAIYGREGTLTYMLPQVDTFETNPEPFPQIQTDVGNIILSSDNDLLDVRWEKDKTLPNDEKYLSKYLVNIYSDDENEPKLITQVDNGINIHLQWTNNTTNKPQYYIVGIQSVFVINGQETKMKQQFASTKPEQGLVTVNYVDDKGVPIKPIVRLTGDVGSEYQTEQLDITGYEFLNVDGQTSGIFTSEHITVTYKYKEIEVVKGTVTVSYKATDGTKLKDDVVITQPVGTPYTASQDEIEGYTFDSVVGDATGIITVEPKEVIFYYNEVIVVEYGTVTVKYLDENSQPIKEQLVLTGEVGTTYNTTQETITGYDYVSVTGNTTGTYINGNIDVVYNYMKQEVVEFQKISPIFESLEAKYEAPQRTSSRVFLRGTDDIAQHPSLHDSIKGYSIQIYGITNTGTERFISNLNVTGRLNDNEELVTGYFTMTSSEVGLKIRIRSQYDINGTTHTSDFTDAYLIYKNVWTTLFSSKGKVIVNYIDEDSSSTMETVTLTGNVGSTYTTEQKDFSSNDFKFSRVVGETTGTFTKEDIVVNYYYVWSGW